jgi:hypothetical protein
MHEYLFHRSQHCPSPDTPPEWLADDVFFHQWTTRQHPFNEIESGDRLWWADKESREVRWDLRVVEVLKQQFNSPTEALNLLRRGYGLIPDDLNSYFAAAPQSGWLLAFAIEVMQPITGVTLPVGERLGRNGLRTMTPELRTQLESVGLPAPAAVPLTHPPAAMNAQAVTAIFVPNPNRHIPSSVKAEVWDRSGAICQECNKRVDRNEIHFDHYIPFSRGGLSTSENLRVLCAPCNVSKGAKMPPRANVKVFDEPVADLAAILGRNQPRSIDDFLDLLSEAGNSGELDALRAAVLTLYRDPEFADSDLDRCVDAIEGSAGLEDLVTFLRIRLDPTDDFTDELKALLNSKDSAIRLEAGVELCGDGSLTADVAGPILLEAINGTDRYLSDLALITARGVEGLNLDSQLPELETLLDSPVVIWRSSVAYAFAVSMFEGLLEGVGFDYERFQDLCDVALTSPDSAIAHQSAVLLAKFWSHAGTEDSKRMTNQYLNFASQSDDDNLLAQVETLRQSLQSS